MIEITHGHCRVVHIGNDVLNMKTAVIANWKGTTQIYGIEDEITEKDMAKLVKT